MKQNQWVLFGTVLGITLSATSLGLQLKHGGVSVFDRYRKAASSLEFHRAEFNNAAVRANLPFRSGVGTPFAAGLSDDGRQFIVITPVKSAALPRVHMCCGHGPTTTPELERVLSLAAIDARSAFAATFKEDHRLTFEHDVVIKYVDFELIAEGEPLDQGTVATFQNQKFDWGPAFKLAP